MYSACSCCTVAPVSRHSIPLISGQFHSQPSRRPSTSLLVHFDDGACCYRTDCSAARALIKTPSCLAVSSRFAVLNNSSLASKQTNHYQHCHHIRTIYTQTCTTNLPRQYDAEGKHKMQENFSPDT